MSAKGILYVVSGPSGAGKGTICQQVCANDETIKLTVSATTRNPRDGEVDGKHYYFLTVDDFKARLSKGEFLEHNEYCGNFYGTLVSEVKKITEAGKDCILEIDINGGLNVKKAYPDAVLIFVIPPSFGVLRKRLVKRGTEEEDVINKRLATAQKEILVASEYDYILINDVLEDAINDFAYIRKASHMLPQYNQNVLDDFK